MPIHLNTQVGGLESIGPGEAGNAAQKQITGVVIAVGLRYTGGKWQYNLNNATGWHECASQDYYDPPIRVRAVNMMETSNGYADLCYDLAGNGELMKTHDVTTYQTAIIETLMANTNHPMHLTRIWFTGTTNTASILLKG